MRVLEVGGAPGAAARAVAARIGPDGHVLVLDRSATGIRQLQENCQAEIAAGTLSVLHAPVEDFALPDGVALFDLAFACRVGALDGRHPRLYESALEKLREALTPGASLYVDTGSPLAEVSLR